MKLLGNVNNGIGGDPLISVWIKEFFTVIFSIALIRNIGDVVPWRKNALPKCSCYIFNASVFSHGTLYNSFSTVV